MSKFYSNNWFKRYVNNFEKHTEKFDFKQIKCLEIGSFEGQSSNWIVDNWCKHPESSLTCVDPFTGSEEHSATEKEQLFERFCRNIEENSKKIIVMRETSHVAMQRLIDKKEKFDFIYIDGDHHRDAVTLDAELAHQLLVPGGILAFDDYTWELHLPSEKRPRDAIDGFLQKRAKEYELITKNDQVFVKKRFMKDDADNNAHLKPKKLKIAVYTITKNEEKFIKRYCETASLADQIVIIDTGSTDRTVEIAKECGAIVHKICISPWRFDTARTASLALLDEDVDVCVALDADEVLEPGWRDEIERLWVDGTTRFKYVYDWGCDIRFDCDKIHARKGYVWKFACHEWLIPDPRIEQRTVVSNKLIIRHLPDNTKSRGQYLDILQVDVKENPSGSRHSFYYARELTFCKRHEEAIEELKRYMELPSATWKEERSFAMRLLANSYFAIGEKDKAMKWYKKAAEILPYRKEPWFALANFCYKTGSWKICHESALKCIETPSSTAWPVDAEVDGFQPYDLAAISAYRLGDIKSAVKYGNEALKMAPDDARLKENMKWYLGEM